MVLYSNGSAIETRFPQRVDVFVSQPARIDFHAGLDVRGDIEARANKLAEGTDFLGQKERRRAAAKVELTDLAFRMKQLRHQVHFLLKILQIGRALALLRRDYGRATAIPAERLAERQVEIKRDITLGFVVGANFLQHAFRRHLIAELSRRRIRRVPRAGNAVFLNETEVEVESAHYLKLRTVSTRLSMHSSLAVGGTPCEVEDVPLASRISSSRRVASSETISGRVFSRKDRDFPARQ